MARPLWTGTLNFGLVSVPVEVHTAVHDKGPRFRMLRRRDKSPIKYQRIAERDAKVVEWENIVKGYEYQKGHFIVLTAEDFEKAAVKKDRAIEILDFVDANAVDDRYFDKPYYLLPGKGGGRAYALLREAIRESGRIGVAKFVLRTKQRLAAVEPIGDALVLSTMRFRDELAKLEDFEFPPAKDVRKRDLQVAVRLIQEFSAEWDPDKYTDDYRQNIMAIIEAKRQHTEPELEIETAEQSADVVDLMERLRKSLGTRTAPGSRARGARSRARRGAATAAGARRRAGSRPRKRASRRTTKGRKAA